jgi:hypothetical protein
VAEAIPAIERMRALRRDSYRCQHRAPRGRPCLKPTAHVDYIDPRGPRSLDNVATRCRPPAHEEP